MSFYPVTQKWSKYSVRLLQRLLSLSLLQAVKHLLNLGHYMKYEIACGNVGSVSTILYIHEFDTQSVRTL